MTRYSDGGLRLTYGDPCEGGDGMCPNDATLTVVDKTSKPWRVCQDHARYVLEASPQSGEQEPTEKTAGS